MLMEILFGFVFAFVQWYPKSHPGNENITLHCLGRNEIFFKFDYFVEGGHDRSTKDTCNFDNYFAKWSCYFSLFLAASIQSNLLEIFLTGKILFEMKKKTNDISSMLTRKVFEERKM